MTGTGYDTNQLRAPGVQEFGQVVEIFRKLKLLGALHAENSGEVVTNTADKIAHELHQEVSSTPGHLVPHSPPHHYCRPQLVPTVLMGW